MNLVALNPGFGERQCNVRCSELIISKPLRRELHIADVVRLFVEDSSRSQIGHVRVQHIFDGYIGTRRCIGELAKDLTDRIRGAYACPLCNPRWIDAYLRLVLWNPKLMGQESP